MQRYPEKSSIISYLFCAVITTLEAKSKLNGWKIRSMTNNGFGLCVRAGFGAQNCQPALNLNRSTKLQVCTSPHLPQTHPMFVKVEKITDISM